MKKKLSALTLTLALLMLNAQSVNSSSPKIGEVSRSDGGVCSTLNPQCSTAKQSREHAFAVGEAGANLASKFESEAAMVNAQSPDFWSVVNSRTSVRQWQDKPVAKADIEDILRAGMSAPTAMNKQPWRFLVITDAKERNALADKIGRGDMIRKAPAIIVVCGDMSDAFPGDARDFWVEDCSAASENILLAITAKGLGGVWTGAYPTKRSQEIHDALALPENIIPLNVILFGYPKDTPTPKDKWKPENIHWEKW